MKISSTAKIAILVIAVIATAGLWMFQGQSESQPSATLISEQALPAPQPIVRVEPEPAVELELEPVKPEAPSLLAAPDNLSDSDTQVHRLAELIAPEFVQWLLPQQQIRKWVATVDMMSEGRIPRKYPGLNLPLGKFKVEKTGDTITSNPGNFNRADVLVAALTAIDPKLLASYIDYWQPVLEKANREQGKPGSFNDRLDLTIDNIIALETLPENTELVQPHVFYQYADPALEKRSDLDKLVWRLGTKNQLALQQYLKELKRQKEIIDSHGSGG